mgnify:CR=1 FL=1
MYDRVDCQLADSELVMKWKCRLHHELVRALDCRATFESRDREISITTSTEVGTGQCLMGKTPQTKHDCFYYMATSDN